MLTTAQGIYHDGIVELDERPDNIIRGRVVVLFLENSPVEGKTIDSTSAAERIAALRAWLSSLPPVPPVPLDTLDREQLYK